MSEYLMNEKYEKAIVALLTSPTVPKAAHKIGIHPRTLYKWLHEDDLFIKLYADARARCVETTIAQLMQHSTKAARVLIEVAADPNSSDSARVASASKIIELAMKGYEYERLQTQIEELKAQLHAMQAMPIDVDPVNAKEGES